MIMDQAMDLVYTLRSDYKTANMEKFLMSVASTCQDIKLLCGKLELKSLSLLRQVLEKTENREDYLTDILKSDDQVPHDSGCRPAIIINNQRKYLVKLGPYQPKLSSLPKNQAMKAKKDKCFSSRWYAKYLYVEYSIVTGRAYSFVCTLFSHGSD